MTKQKKGFWLFISSLLPGAGELYMGFRKMGISIMSLFFGIIACATFFNLEAFIFLLPILWFYSFFNVHNLKNLTEEEFLTIEDDYILHMDAFISDNKERIKKYRQYFAILLIILGISGLWSPITSWLVYIFPMEYYEMIAQIGYQLPTLIVSLLLIIIGINLVKGKKEQLEKREELEKHEDA